MRGRRVSRRIGAALAGLCLVTLVLSAPAAAKLGVTVAASTRLPRVDQPVTFVVHCKQSLTWDLRLIAVAPGEPVFSVVATITGDSSRPLPHVQRRGFEVTLVRSGGTSWRGVARFPKAGHWHLVVPNEAPMGVIFPDGAASLTLVVR